MLFDHRDGLCAGDDLGVRILLKNERRGARVILLNVLNDEVVQVGDRLELSHQRIRLRRIRCIDERSLLTPLKEVRVVAGSIGQRNQLIKQPAFPIDRTHP